MTTDNWISVKDGLPEEGEDILCYCTAKSQFDGSKNTARVTGYFKDGRFITAFSYMAALVRDIYVTHWQPLPKPPKEKIQSL